jgi:ABC-type antimicrobial peptide transport system permease subunit
MALGAGRGRVLSMVLAQGGVMISGGLIVGLGAAFGTTRLIANSLFGVTPTDLTTFAATALVLIVVSLLATLIPARRATKVDPLVALRYE